MTSNRYIEDTKALPPVLVTRCRAAVGSYYRVITFRCGGPLTKTEKELGPVLVQECRDALMAHWETARSVRVYIKGSHGSGRLCRSETAAIRFLSAKGHSAQAIADVLGVALETVSASSARYHDKTPERMGPDPKHEAAGTNVLRKRLGQAYPFLSLIDLAAQLGADIADIRVRAREAGAAYAALKKASS